MKLSWEEFWYGICLRYWVMPQDIPGTCDDCGKKFLIDNSLSCPKGGLVLKWHDNAVKEWGALGDRALTPSAISYEPQINSRIVQGEMTGSGARRERETSKGSTDIVGESQCAGINGRSRNGVDGLERTKVQVSVPAELRSDVSAHGF